MTFDATQLFAYTPMLILIGMGCVILLAETFVRGPSRAGLGRTDHRPGEALLGSNCETRHPGAVLVQLDTGRRLQPDEVELRRESGRQ